MNHLQVFNFNEKKRIGRNNDGGYVTAILPDVKYSMLISAGIDNDSSFEDQFCEEYGISCIAFDGTIIKSPSKNANVKWIKKNIGSKNSFEFTNLHELLVTNTNVFIKMDIEGSELPWIDSLSYLHLNNIAQLVVEFHDPVASINAIQKLNETHLLVHLHGNNCCGVKNINSINIPNVFECTFVNKKLYNTTVKSNQPSPGPLDMPNISYYEDINLNYKPFVEK